MASFSRNILFCNRNIIFKRRLLTFEKHRSNVLPSCSRLCSQASDAAEKWDLVSAVCLERFPSLTAPLTDMEARYGAMLTQMELERSLLSDHELRHQKDVETAELRKSEDYEESEAEASLQTAAEAQDEWEGQLARFTPASRTTDADHNNDTRSVQRKLDEKLTLLVKQRLGDQLHWVLPQGLREEGESMRQAAERVLASTCGSGVNALFMGNAPCGFLKYRYNADSSTVGAKVFFFKAQLRGGHVEQTGTDIEDHHWLTKHELDNYVEPSYGKVLNKFVHGF